MKKYRKPRFAPISFLFLVFLILCLVSLSISSFLPQSKSSQSILKVLSQNPWQPKPHIQLTQIYFQAKNETQAQQELALTKSLILWHKNKPQVLGTDTEVQSAISEIQTKPQIQQKMNSFWGYVVSMHPSYRDGWVQLYFLAVNDNNRQKAKEYGEKIKQLDPLFQLPTLSQ